MWVGESEDQPRKSAKSAERQPQPNAEIRQKNGGKKSVDRRKESEGLHFVDPRR
jgi:hypothetical protein